MKRIRSHQKFLNVQINSQLQKNGKKNTAEKNCKKTLKQLQANYTKKSKNIVKLALKNAIFFYKVHTYEQKRKKRKVVKKIPGFIVSKTIRNSLTIKSILSEVKPNKKIYISITENIVNNAINESKTITQKNEILKQILFYKHLFKYFKLH
jgi:ribosomal protein S7